MFLASVPSFFLANFLTKLGSWWSVGLANRFATCAWWIAAEAVLITEKD
jgi:hypothetical protein